MQQFIAPSSANKPDRSHTAALAWIANHCRKVARSHMALADKAEMLLEQYVDDRRFRLGLRTFARHHRRAAWQHLEMAHRAEAARQSGLSEFDLTDVVST